MSRILAIDYGDVRVGLALTDPLNITAQGLETLVINGSDKKFISGIRKIISESDVKKVVLGNPKNMDGTELTISNQDTITKAKEVKIKEDISTFKTDFNSYIDEKKFEAISVGQYYDEETDEELKDVRGYSNLKAIIPSMLDSYGSVLAIKNGKITYIGSDEKYKTIMQEMGIEVQ